MNIQDVDIDHNGQRDAAMAGANTVSAKSVQADIESFMDTQPPPWFLREIEEKLQM